MEQSTLKHKYLIISEKKSVKLDGVNNIEAFDETCVSLITVAGKITVEGIGLKIESLNADNGEIFITGNISAVYFSEQKIHRGLFERLFG